MSIYLIAGKDGAYLKHGKEGLVFIRMYNQAEKKRYYTTFYRYGKGRHGDLKPSYLTSDITFYAGFEIATVKYYFIDSGGNNIIENVIVCSPDSLNLSPKQYKLLSIPIRTPPRLEPINLNYFLITEILKKLLIHIILLTRISNEISFIVKYSWRE